MFTGIVAEAGKVVSINRAPGTIRLVVRAARTGKGLHLGDSVALNGCCLTVVKLQRSRSGVLMHFDLLDETWNRTNLRFLQPASLINLERPLQANGRLDGHFVTGHVDGVGKIDRIKAKGKDHLLEISAEPRLMDLLVSKGSVAVDGVSLTVAELRKESFIVWIIPHTWKITALSRRKHGAAVNLEMDILGKYVARFLNSKMKTRV